VQGLVAAGTNPESMRKGGTPLSYLAARQAPDGHYRYSAGSDQTPVWVTSQALLAVNRRAFPIAAVRRDPVAARAPKGKAGQPPAAAPGAVVAPKKKKAGKGGGGVQAPAASADFFPAPEPVPAPAATDGDDDDGPSAALIAAGSVLAACALAGAGWLLYRRRFSS
jgi:hypothetical protein